MNHYILLGCAIVAEVVGTTLMKYSEGFTRLWPSVATIVCYCAAFYLLAQTLATIPTGIAYAIWSGAGIVLISLAGWLISGQKLDFPAIAGMTLICAGVLIINIFEIHAALMGWPREQIYLLQRRVNEKSVSEKGGAGAGREKINTGRCDIGTAS